jgi:AcrR family transcriptional regulator
MVHTIVGAAAIEFGERGYAAASYGLIAERAGVTKSLVSYHFASKSTLALAILQRAFSDGVFMNQSAPASNPLAELVASTAAVASAVVTDPVARAAMRLQSERGLINGPVPVPFVGWTRRTEETLRTARRDGLLSGAFDPAEEAYFFIATFIGLKHMAEAQGEWSAFPRRAAAGTAARLMLLGASEADLREGIPASESPENRVLPTSA